jgi:GNAT superfamily N-acetyltransferase
MRTRSPSLRDRAALLELINPPPATPSPSTDLPPNPFRPDEVACAIELLEAVLAQAEGNTYEARIVVDEGDVPQAYACFGHTPMTEATFDLYWMVTAVAQRGKGLGAQLLSAVEAELASRGVQRIRVETSSLEGQGGALRFYLRCGYELVGTIADFYRPGDALLTLVKRLVLPVPFPPPLA